MLVSITKNVTIEYNTRIKQNIETAAKTSFPCFLNPPIIINMNAIIDKTNEAKVKTILPIISGWATISHTVAKFSMVASASKTSCVS